MFYWLHKVRCFFACPNQPLRVEKLSVEFVKPGFLYFSYLNYWGEILSSSAFQWVEELLIDQCALLV